MAIIPNNRYQYGETMGRCLDAVDWFTQEIKNCPARATNGECEFALDITPDRPVNELRQHMNALANCSKIHYEIAMMRGRSPMYDTRHREARIRNEYEQAMIRRGFEARTYRGCAERGADIHGLLYHIIETSTDPHYAYIPITQMNALKRKLRPCRNLERHIRQ